MKNIILIPLVFLFVALFIGPVSAEETRNQYSNSIMLKAPKVYEDASHKTETELHNQHCLDLQEKIKDLKYRPVRRNAARERYQTECLNR